MTVEFEDQRGIAASADALAGPASPSQELALGHRDDLEEIAIAVRGRMIGIREDVIAIGRDLLRAKALLEYGQWMPWLRAEFNMTSRTAENYMNLAERLGYRFETLSNLGWRPCTGLSRAPRLMLSSTP